MSFFYIWWIFSCYDNYFEIYLY